MEPSRFHRAANDWIKELAVCVKNVGMYAPEHPRAKQSLERSIGMLEALFEGRLSLALTCMDGRLCLDNVPVERDRAVASRLTGDLVARSVRSVEFAAGFSAREYSALVRALLLKPERVAERGGMEAVLLDEGVSAITVNRARTGKITDAMDLLNELSIMGLLSGRTGGGAEGASESMSSLMARDHGALAAALADAAARKDRSAPPGNPDFQADQVALSLERLAQRALEEEQRPRAEILADVGRIVAASPPPIQMRLMLPRSGMRHGREALISAVETMSAETIAEVVSRQQSGSEVEYGVLHDAIERTAQWRDDRQATLEAIERRLASRRVSPAESKEILDHLMWNELDLSRRAQLLHQRDHLWRVDFQRIREVLVKLFGTDQVKEATALIQKYLSGLLVEDTAQRRRVAENARFILQLIEKTGKGMPMLTRIGELFMARLQDEPDDEVQTRLSSALAYLADLRLRSGETAAVLALMRRADEMASAPAADLRERGERLRGALSRAGNEKLFSQLADRHLGGDDGAALEAAEILKRSGPRAVDYLIERLAIEEDRGRRADLVHLLKEMDKSVSRTFVERLEDPRWFLVRNVIHILGELGDPAVLPSLRRAARHDDPRVRKEVVKTGVRLGGPDGEDLVAMACADPDRSVQVAAANALSGMKGRETAAVILDLIGRTGIGAAADGEVRQEAITAAGRRKMTEAVRPLCEMLRKKGLLGYAESTELRMAAARTLGAIGGGEAVEALKAASKEDARGDVREVAVAALNELEATHQPG